MIPINTFDVFDTLIARRCIHPTNIFALLEEKYTLPGFANARQQAEQDLIGQTYTLNDIYNNLRKFIDIGKLSLETLKQAEIEEELINVIAIQENISKVKDGDLLISDMYLPKKWVKALLEKAGLQKEVGLIVSNYGKHSGTIWPKIQSMFSITRHLGDSPHADGLSAAHYGIDFGITEISQITQLEKIFFDINLPTIGEILRQIRLETWNENIFERKLQEFQFSFNFPILLFSSLILYDVAKNLKKKKVVFSARDCCLWKDLFETLFPNEFDYEYFYTSRYSKCLSDDDYLEYSNSIITDDCILVDLCGSGWTTEFFAQKLKVQRLDTFFIHQMPQDRDYMQSVMNSKCHFHHIILNETEELRNHLLEIASFAKHPMLKTMKSIDGNFLPVFFPETRSDLEMNYVSIQHETFKKCINTYKKRNLSPQTINMGHDISTQLIKILYRIMSRDIIINFLFSITFFQENNSIENKLRMLVSQGRH